MSLNNKNMLVSDEYLKKYDYSIKHNEEFWQKQALENLSWNKKFSVVKNVDFSDVNNIKIKWFEDGELNVCYNCVDRHVENGNGNKIAFIWQGEKETEQKQITYHDLQKEVAKFANLLEKYQVKKGDKVIIYMPMILEAVYSMLACSRIGAVHSVVFGGFSANSLRDRIIDCIAKFIITADEGIRGSKIIALKNNVEEAIDGLENQIQKVFLVKRTSNQVKINKDRDIIYNDEISSMSEAHNPVSMNAEDPLFILYTSGSTGKPKGLVHSSAGYLLYSLVTFKKVFDYQSNDIFWSTADIGWITGHSYLVYGPLAAGASSVIYEGNPNYPDPSRCWKIIDKYKVSIFYTSPTLIRSLIKEGDDYVTKSSSRNSLRILGSVGEPINPEVWNWYNEVVGNHKCYIVDTWWQTETGGHIITPIPDHIKTKAGYATLPFLGIELALLDDNGNKLELGNSDTEISGNLCIKNSWPGQARSINGDHKRFGEVYFSKFPNYYFSGDGAKQDRDGYYQITGRVDDVINISGHRIGTMEVESVVVSHPDIAEAAVVGARHSIKGEALYVFAINKSAAKSNQDLVKEINQLIRKNIGGIAMADFIQIVPDLPKTRSGKIMRRILRKIANNDFDNLGDTNTLINPDIVKIIIDNRLNQEK